MNITEILKLGKEDIKKLNNNDLIKYFNLLADEIEKKLNILDGIIDEIDLTPITDNYFQNDLKKREYKEKINVAYKAKYELEFKQAQIGLELHERIK